MTLPGSHAPYKASLVRSRIVAVVTIVALVLSAVSGRQVVAQTDVAPEFSVTAEPAPGARIAHNAGAGAFLMVWLDGVLLARRLDESGRAVGTPSQISADLQTIRGFDVVATREAFVVTWTAADETFARTVSTDGVPVGDPVPLSMVVVSDAVRSVRSAPAIALDPRRAQLLVVWVATSNDPAVPGRDEDVVGRLLGPDLEPIGDVFQIGFTFPPGEFEEPPFPWEPDVAFDPIGDAYVVVWVENPGDFPPAPELFVTVVSPQADVLDPSVLVGSFRETIHEQSGAQNPVVSVDPTAGEYLVVWSGYAPDELDGPGSLAEFREIVARSYDRTLTPTSGVFTVSTDNDTSSDVEAIAPEAIWLPSAGEHIVVWAGAQTVGEDAFSQTAGVDHELRGARVAEGVVRGDPFDITVPNGGPSDVAAPSLASHPGGEPVLTVWSEEAQAGALGTWLTSPVDALAGYLMLEADGRTHGFGDAETLAADPSGSADIDLTMTPTMAGYWRLATDGTISEVGDAPDVADVDLGTLAPGESVTTIASTATGAGYWVFTDRGRAVPFGDAAGIGDVSHLDLDGPVIDSVVTPSGSGYYLLGSDGGVFTFGDAAFHGSVPQVLPGVTLDGPVVGIVPTPTGNGYWLVATDGGVFAFGDAKFSGSIPQILPGVTLDGPVNGMVAFGNGYLMVASDGGVFNFSDLPFFGSLGGVDVAHPIVGIAAVVR